MQEGEIEIPLLPCLLGGAPPVFSTGRKWGDAIVLERVGHTHNLGHIVQYIAVQYVLNIQSYRVIVMKLRIRDLREDKDLKQKEIAEYLVCDQSLYSKYEREERELPLRCAVLLAEFYHVSVDYLLGLTDEVKPYPRKRK